MRGDDTCLPPPPMMPDASALRDLGWSAHFQSQVTEDEAHSLAPARISEVTRDRVTGLTGEAAVSLTLPGGFSAGELAVGDWVLFAPGTERVARVLDRVSELSRRASGRETRAQLIAANIDTLFITTSCNADFSAARLERALALAYEAGVTPVILLTRADLTDPAPFLAEAQSAAPGVEVIALNAKDPNAVAQLARFAGPGHTVALIGMSGTGKSTLANALCGTDQATGEIREDDARGRHTTTARSLHRTLAGGWLIDTPGMREMGVLDAAGGIEAVFSEITELAAQCRFRNCTHGSEPGCAVQAAIAAGELDPERLARWRRLLEEDARATETATRAKGRKQAPHYRAAAAARRRPKRGK